MKRRTFFKNIAGLSGLALVAPAIIASLQPSAAFAEEARRKKPGQESDMVDVNDPTAKAVGYIEDFKKSKKAAGNKCSTCALYGKTEKKNGKDVGPCALFPKKFVTADGFCNSWAKKA